MQASGKTFFQRFLRRKIFRSAEKTFFFSACRPEKVCIGRRNVPENDVRASFSGLIFCYLKPFRLPKADVKMPCLSRFVLSHPALSCAEPRNPAFRMLPESSLWTTDCLPAAPRESRISADLRTGTQITDSHEGRFDFLTKTLVPHMKAHMPKPSVREASSLPYFHVL